MFAQRPHYDTVLAWLLAVLLIAAGSAHLVVAPAAFYAQVPPWLPLEPDLVIWASGIVEIILGAAVFALPHHRRVLALIYAGYFCVVWVGNIHQWLAQIDAFGLESDQARLVRVSLQPVLILAALGAAGIFRLSPTEDGSEIRPHQAGEVITEPGALEHSPVSASGDPQASTPPHADAKALTKTTGYLQSGLLALIALAVLMKAGERGWRAVMVSFMFAYIAVGLGYLHSRELMSRTLARSGGKAYRHPVVNAWVISMVVVIALTALALWSSHWQL
ncbi:MAG: hypothetical protein Q4Q03_01495 [Bowdeniella nasicola]|nr:hypothetical protein [Bowdeniella nasicola]